MGLVLLVYTHELVYPHSPTRTHAHTYTTHSQVDYCHPVPQELAPGKQVDPAVPSKLPERLKLKCVFALCIFRRVISNVKCACAAHVATRAIDAGVAHTVSVAVERLRLVSGVILERFLWILSPIRAPFFYKSIRLFYWKRS